MGDGMSDGLFEYAVGLSREQALEARMQRLEEQLAEQRRVTDALAEYVRALKDVVQALATVERFT